MNLIKSLLGSKKFIAAIIGVIIAIGGRYGLSFDPDLVREILAIFIAYIIGQGIADHGTGAAKVQAVSAQATGEGPIVGVKKAQEAVTKMAEGVK